MDAVGVVILCFGVPLVLGLVVWATLNWILGPLNRAAENRQYPIQYSLADLLSLFVLVQFPIGIIHWIAHETRADGAAEVTIDVFILIVAILLWWNTARLLSRAGVHRVSRRAVVLIVIVPSLIVGPLAVFVPVMGVMGVMDSGNVLWLFAYVPIIGILYLLGRFTRATVASAALASQGEQGVRQNAPASAPLIRPSRCLVCDIAIVAALLGLVALAGCIALLALPFVAPLACLNWVLGPLDRAARNRQFPIQFGLADLLCLFILIQLPVGILHWTLADVLKEGIVAGDILLGIAAGSIWWVCWHTMSRAGIQVVWQRCVVLALVLPGGYVGSIALAVLPFVAGALFMSHRSTIAWLVLLVEILLPGVLYYFGCFTRKIVATSRNSDVAMEVILVSDDDETPTVSEEP
jgi:hypothetical protein